MFDHRLAQVTYQDHLDSAKARRRQKARGQKKAGFNLSPMPVVAKVALVLTSVTALVLLAANVL
jgi:hypothetical protein